MKPKVARLFRAIFFGPLAAHVWAKAAAQCRLVPHLSAMQLASWLRFHRLSALGSQRICSGAGVFKRGCVFVKLIYPLVN